jgi:hypothetical protein
MIKAALPGSALAGFRYLAWGQRLGGQPDPLVEATARNDLVTVGRLIGARDVNTILFESPVSSVPRWRELCSLLDIAFGAGAVEVTMYLLEFHNATVTRETLMMAISSGNVRLIRLAWHRFPEGRNQGRGDLLEVAAHCHQPEPLSWLFREATDLEREAFMAFALEHHLADALVPALADGFRPWWGRSRMLASVWPPARGLEFRAAPSGFHVDGGWWVDHCGVGHGIVPRSWLGLPWLLGGVEPERVAEVVFAPEATLPLSGPLELRRVCEGCSTLRPVSIPE